VSAVHLLHAELEALADPTRSAHSIATSWTLRGAEREVFLRRVAEFRARPRPPASRSRLRFGRGRGKDERGA
jgi:hypothetical protein